MELYIAFKPPQLTDESAAAIGAAVTNGESVGAIGSAMADSLAIGLPANVAAESLAAQLGDPGLASELAQGITAGRTAYLRAVADKLGQAIGCEFITIAEGGTKEDTSGN